MHFVGVNYKANDGHKYLTDQVCKNCFPDHFYQLYLIRIFHEICELFVNRGASYYNLYYFNTRLKPCKWIHFVHRWTACSSKIHLEPAERFFKFHQGSIKYAQNCNWKRSLSKNFPFLEVFHAVTHFKNVHILVFNLSHRIQFSRRFIC